MKLKHFAFTLIFVAMATFSFAQDAYVGKWKTVDDTTGETKAYVEIYNVEGKLYGKIVKVLDEDKAVAVCEKCKGDKKNKSIEGLVILEGLVKKGDYYGGGYITDPENGKEYKCYIEMDGEGKLKVRGYVGAAAMGLGRTQYWYSVK